MEGLGSKLLHRDYVGDSCMFAKGDAKSLDYVSHGYL